MGSHESKLTVDNLGDQPSSEETGSIPSTPILTPKIFRENIEKDNLDPRSPSKHIARTPIEVSSSVINKLDTPIIETNKEPIETPLKRHLILDIDPRSPSLELQRTPIVVNTSSDQTLPAKIRNKNLEKVINSALISSPKTIPPKLLESNLVTPKIKSDPQKRKSLVLLETNIDFTETDLDVVIQEKYLAKRLEGLSTNEDTPSCDLDDPRSPSVDFLRTPIQVCKITDATSDDEVTKAVGIIEEHSVEHVHNDVRNYVHQPDDIVQENEVEELKDNNTEINKVNNFIEVIKVEEKNYAKEAVIVTNANDTGTEVFEPNSSGAATELTSVTLLNATPKQNKSEPITPSVIDITADVRELDKKLSDLIYQDEETTVSSNRNLKLKDQSRTPLGLRNGNDGRKGVQKLKVSDKPRKTQSVGSKIPVFKEKKIKVQCENTPPCGMRGGRPKKTQWDTKDDTLII